MEKKNKPGKLTRAISLSRQVVNKLGEQIVSGQLAVGETLPNEDALQAELKVSRTVVREAVKILTDKGLIDVRTRRGTRVCPQKDWNMLDPDVLRWQYNSGPTREFLRNVAEVRRSIEVTAAELAATRATPADIEHIRACYKTLEATINDKESHIEADMHFHESIFAACHNELLSQLAINLRTALQSSRKITSTKPGWVHSALPLHEAVMEAIANRDVDAARQATYELIDRSVADIDLILSAKS